MMDKLFPETVTNHYGGHALAKRVLAALTLMTIGRSLVHMFAEDGRAYSPGLETAHTAPGAVGNILFLPLGMVMLFLSLRGDSQS